MADIAEIYSRIAQVEWDRTSGSFYHSLEFLVTMDRLRKHLPANGRVLDAGGGPGRYAIQLCREGWELALCDLAPGNIEFAKEKFADEPEAIQQRLVDARVGDVRALPYSDSSFDAVICLGGCLSHLPETADQELAVRELVRVAQPGATVAFSGIGYLAVLRTILIECSHELVNGVLDRLLVDGNAVGPYGMLWHFFRGDELRRLAESAGLETLEMAGCQGLSAGCEEATNSIEQDEQKRQRWLDLVIATASEPAVAEMAEHILYIGRKAA